MFGPSDLINAIKAWPVESQQQARRNAMIASTALTQRRAEFDDVEEFFAALGKNTAQPGTEQAAHG